MTIKINSETYVQLFRDWPDNNFTLFNWNWKVYYLFGLFPVVVYNKKLI